MARKSRSIIETVKPKYRVWRIAIYIRLSKEDARCFDESESVTNQRKIIEDHIAAFNDGDEYLIVDEYVDDGISGTTDDERDDFQRMLSDIKRGRINCVIVKDLSRLGRNYVEAGNYIERVFPFLDVRFISVNDGFDSFRCGTDLSMPLKNIVNEYYAKDISRKVTSALQTKMEQGDYIGNYAPHGYCKDPENKNALIVDDEAAEVVQNIYQWFVYEGMSKNGIARRLNDLGIASPAAYKKNKGLNFCCPQSGKNDGLWSPSAVSLVLNNLLQYLMLHQIVGNEQFLFLSKNAMVLILLGLLSSQLNIHKCFLLFVLLPCLHISL